MDDILRFTGAVRHAPAIKAWFSGPEELRQLVRPWFDRMRACGADVRELLHDGCPTACVGDAPFGYVNAFRAHANVGFFRGAELDDPAGLLQGTGKRMRHVKLVWGAPVNSAALEVLIAAAYRDIRARLGHAPKDGKPGLFKKGRG
ncbi:MAG TPA: DUF1801 domain-containing protein [Rhizomicrobium sp.]|nr:DUF1801 domain-containing protein [Rhizomicrobium sp.]